MKNVHKIISWLVLVLMLMSMLFTPVEAAENDSQHYEENPTTDFVLLIDCSNSMPQTDPYGLCSTACRMFLDMLPLENARVAVIAFGSADIGKKVNLHSHSYPNTAEREEAYVRVLFPLTSVKKLRENGIDQYKADIDVALSANGMRSLIGMASLAAFDLLEHSDATPGNACIIILSDGDNSTQLFTHGIDEQLQLDVAVEAGKKSNQWPMYGLQMNLIGEREEINWKRDVERMLQMTQSSGAGGENEGRYLLEDFSSGSKQIAKAFLGIFDRFLRNQGDIQVAQIDESGTRSVNFTINDIVSEATIVAAGGGVHDITLKNGNTILKADTNRFDVEAENIGENDYIISGESGRYICVKLICPEPGEWTATFSGDKNAEFVIYQCSMSDMDIELGCSRDLEELIEQKDDEIWLNAVFKYHGKDVQPSQYVFEKMPAKLYAVDNSNEDNVIALDDLDLIATASGYRAKITMNYLLHKFSANEGSYDIFLRVENDIFRDHHKFSNKLGPFKTKDEHIEKIKEIEDQNGYTNQEIRKIYLPDYIRNEDGDPLSYDLICKSDRTRTFPCAIDDDFLEIQDCGAEIAAYEMILTVSEPSNFTLEYPFTLNVVNRPPSYPSVLSGIELMIEPVDKEEEAKNQTVIDLSAFYHDDDGDAPIFSGFEGKENNTDVFKLVFDEKSSQLTVKGLKSGEQDIHFTVSDQYSDPIDVTVPLKVISGKEELCKKIRSYWWVLLILAGIAAAACLIKYRTKVRGKWNFKVAIGNDDTNFALATVDINKQTRVGRKKSKFLLQDLFFGKKASDRGVSSKLVVLQEESEGYIHSHLKEYFNHPGMKKASMKGFLSGQGFELSGWDSRSIDVQKNGNLVTSKAKLFKGRKASTQTLSITIPHPSDTNDSSKKLHITIS